MPEELVFLCFRSYGAARDFARENGMPYWMYVHGVRCVRGRRGQVVYRELDGLSAEQLEALDVAERINGWRVLVGALRGGRE